MHNFQKGSNSSLELDLTWPGVYQTHFGMHQRLSESDSNSK